MATQPPAPPAPPSQPSSPALVPGATTADPSAPVDTVAEVKQAATDADAVKSDLHILAEDAQAEYAKMGDKTKNDLVQLLRDATILRGEGVTALKKLFGV